MCINVQVCIKICAERERKSLKYTNRCNSMLTYISYPFFLPECTAVESRTKLYHFYYSFQLSHLKEFIPGIMLIYDFFFSVYIFFKRSFFKRGEMKKISFLKSRKKLLFEEIAHRCERWRAKRNLRTN